MAHHSDVGGRVVPSVEVFDNTTGRVALYLNPAAARTSEFGPGRIENPGSLVGSNAQSDPPGFGIVTLTAGQGIRTNVWCSAHGIGNTPPDPCRGTVMFHDALLEGFGFCSRSFQNVERRRVLIDFRIGRIFGLLNRSPLEVGAWHT